jgi:hypothetical protein
MKSARNLVLVPLRLPKIGGNPPPPKSNKHPYPSTSHAAIKPRTTNYIDSYKVSQEISSNFELTFLMSQSPRKKKTYSGSRKFM